MQGNLRQRFITKIRRTARGNPVIYRLYCLYCYDWGYNWRPFLEGFTLSDILRFRKLSLILTVKPYSLLFYARLSKLYDLATSLERSRVDGSFVECGVWNGGSAAVVASVAKRNRRRHIWLFDSWQGLPAPDPIDVNPEGELGREGSSFGHEEKARELLFAKLRLDESRVHLIRGWFQDTLPMYKKEIGHIALLHLDGDWYKSIKLSLEELYDQVIPGGYIVIDDYGFWQGCKKAVDEFFKSRNVKAELVRIDKYGSYLQK